MLRWESHQDSMFETMTGQQQLRVEGVGVAHFFLSLFLVLIARYLFFVLLLIIPTKPDQ